MTKKSGTAKWKMSATFRSMRTAKSSVPEVHLSVLEWMQTTAHVAINDNQRNLFESRSSIYNLTDISLDIVHTDLLDFTDQKVNARPVYALCDNAFNSPFVIIYNEPLQQIQPSKKILDPLITPSIFTIIANYDKRSVKYKRKAKPMKRICNNKPCSC